MSTRIAPDSIPNATPQAPTPRDLRMHELVTHQDLSQAAVGRAFGLTQARVSQVCRRVREYLALAEPVDAEALEELAVQSETQLAELELIAQKEELRNHALRAVRWGEQEAKTQKQVVRDESGRVLEEVRTTSPRGNLRAIREASRQCEELAELRGVRTRRGGERAKGRGGDAVAEPKPTDEKRSYQMPWHVTPDSVPPLFIPRADVPGTYTAYRPEVYYSVEYRLSKLADGTATLDEIETSLHCDAKNTGWAYPSLFEKCAESINGVRVADWVRTFVPEEKLPQGDDVWLPTVHCLADFDGEDRELIEVDTSERRYNRGERVWRFGTRRGAENRRQTTENSGEGEARWEEEAPAEPRAESGVGDGVSGREGEGGSNFDATISVSPALPLSLSSVHAPPFGAFSPTRLERLLASGRVRGGVARRVFERVVRQRRAK